MKRRPSVLEQRFVEMISGLVSAGYIDRPTREHRFFPGRKWRFDFAWPDRMVAVEIEGGIHSGGRHVTGRGYEADCEKYTAAAVDGWTVMRFTGKHLRNGFALAELNKVFQWRR